MSMRGGSGAEDVPLRGDLNFDPYRSGSFWERNRKLIMIGLVVGVVLLAVLAASIVLIVVLVNEGENDDDDNNFVSLQDRVTFDIIKPHLQGLQAAAVTTWNVTGGNSPTRSIGPGYDESVNYVVSTLKQAMIEAGGDEFCNVTLQNFTAPVWDQLGSPTLSAKINSALITYTANTDFVSIRYGGNNTNSVLRDLLVFNAASGCVDENYDGMQAGQIAIMDDSTSANCSLYSKAMLAESKNAAGVLMYRNAPGLIGSRVYVSDTWNISIPFVQIPVLSILQSVAQTFILLNATVTLSTNQSIQLIPTCNVICATHGALEMNSSTIFIGSHLDSVPAGPGINDDGSGSSINLMLALLMIRNHYKHNNPLVFGWWGAEEIGLIGSRYWVKDFNLHNNNLLARHMAYYINMDMLGSPNGMFQLVNSSTVPVSASLQQSCQKINDKVIGFLNDVAKRPNLLAYTFGGAGSDMMSFWEAGVPMISFATGAGGLMSSSQRLQMQNETWGLANAAMDPCYHLACDTVENVNGQLAEVEAKAVGFLLQETMNQADLLSWLYPENS